MTGLGIYNYGARFYSPKLGRFISADSIVPGYANPQNFNRFAYVRNNPLRYTDPTGHVECRTQEECQDMGTTPGGGFTKPKPTPTPTPTPTPFPTTTPTPNPVSDYCGDISGLACLANLAQDVATLTDLVGVGLIEGPAVAAGCIEGGLLGCAIAEVGVIVTWNLTLNNVEQYASAGSFVFTVLDDLSNNGGWGENSSTSLTTLVAGTLPLTPSWDLAVDTYASGYNHGFFNGVHTIWTDGLFK